MNENKIALITGANKGIGFEVAKQLGISGYLVLVGARDEGRAEEAVAQLSQLLIDAAVIKIDVTDADSIRAAAEHIMNQYGRLDILINNAGISGSDPSAPSATSIEVMRSVYETNVFGVVAVTNAFLPLVRKSIAGRIVNVSSGLGSITLAIDPNSEFGQINFMSYQSSKSALNAVTVCYAKELRDTSMKVNAADPGYTATDFNQHRGYRTVEQAATVIVRLATLGEDGPTGTFQDENGELPW